MLDLKLIRENPDLVRESFARRGEKTGALDDILRLDEERRKLLQQVESSRATVNTASKEIGDIRQQMAAIVKEQAHVEGPPQASKTVEDLKKRLSQLTERSREASQRVEELQPELDRLDKEMRALLLEVPNLVHPTVPEGSGEEDNVEVRRWGEQKSFDFTPLPHWELGEKLGIIDFSRGVKVSGSRFYVLREMGSKLQRALINFMLDLHTTEHGYTEMYPPFMVKRECMVGSGNLPRFADNLYHDEEDDLWFVPTAEVPLTNLHRDETLEPGTLPLCYVAYTACFRREKMSAGKDTRGIKRGHQFDKVELYKFVEPESSDAELERMVHNAEEVCQRLEIPYRVLQLCSGDLGFASTKSYDIEMWARGAGSGWR